MTATEAESRRAPSMSARGQHYLGRLKRRISWFRAAARGAAMLRPARRQDVIECYRAILGREPESASVVDGHSHGRMMLADVVAKLAHSSELRARHLRSNIAYDRLREPNYLAKSLHGIERLQAYYGHYGFLVEALAAPALNALLASHVVLHVQQGDRSEHRVLLTATHERHEEGELQLQLHDGGSVLYVLGFTIVPGEIFGLPNRHILLISRLQGAPGAVLAIRQATKAFGDIQPRAVLLAAAEGLASGLGLHVVMAVTASNQLAFTSHRTEAFAKSYDEFFATAGAERWGEAFFRLDLARERDAPMTASRAHAKRAQRRRGLRREIAAAAAAEARRWTKDGARAAAELPTLEQLGQDSLLSRGAPGVKPGAGYALPI